MKSVILASLLALSISMLTIKTAEARGEAVERAKIEVHALKAELDRSLDNLPPQVVGYVFQFYRDAGRRLDSVLALLEAADNEEPRLCPYTKWTCSCPNPFDGPWVRSGDTEVEARGKAESACRTEGSYGVHCQTMNTSCGSTTEMRPCF